MNETNVTEIVLDENDSAVIQRSLASYQKKSDNMNDVEWLSSFLTEELPEEDSKKIASDAASMVEADIILKKKHANLKESLAKGISKEEWLQLELAEGVEGLNNVQTKAYFTAVDEALKQANEDMRATILRHDGEISQNPHLDGFIAETEHANSFNLDAAIKGKTDVKAEALEPAPGETYGKNSVDIVVKQDGKVVKRYQSKYGANSDRTQELFDKGDYRGQRKLIPEGQEVNTKHTHKLEHDGVESLPLSKQSAKEKQQEAQTQGEIEDKTWDDFTLGQKTRGIAAQASKAGLYAAAGSAAFYVGEHLWNGEEIEGKELAKTVVKDGTKAGATVATAGAIKVIMEKQLKLSLSSPGPTVLNPPGWILPIPDGARNYVPVVLASTAIGAVSTLSRLGNDEISTFEAIDEIEESSLSTIGALICADKGGELAIKAGIAMVQSVVSFTLGPVGIAAIGLVGKTIGIMAGGTAGKLIAKGASIIRKTVVQVAKTVGATIKNVASRVVDTLSSGLDSLKSLFS